MSESVADYVIDKYFPDVEVVNKQLKEYTEKQIKDMSDEDFVLLTIAQDNLDIERSK
jgi:hypothetical protein